MTSVRCGPAASIPIGRTASTVDAGRHTAGRASPHRPPGPRRLSPSRVDAAPTPVAGRRLATTAGDRDELAAQQAAGGRPSPRGAPGPAGPPAGAGAAALDPQMLPPSVAAVVARPGTPLDRGSRARHEARLGVDLGGVRVHDDHGAGVAATELGAAAFTLGPHIAVRPGLYRPGTAEGEALLSHELGHVVSPPVEALIGRQTHPAAGPTPAGATPAGATPAGPAAPAPQGDIPGTIRAWLEQHQLAPPLQQPDTGERHVLLNGEDMAMSQAVGLAAAALQLPADAVRAVLTASLQRRNRSLGPGAGVPIIGPGNVLPGNVLPGVTLSLDSAGHISALTGKMLDLRSIDEWLGTHQFRPPDVRDPTGAAAYLDGRRTTVDAVADQVMAMYRANAMGGLNMSYLTRQEVLDHLRQQYVAARGDPAGDQIVFGYTLVPRLAQAVTGAPDPLNPVTTQHQFSFTITHQYHANDSPGREHSWLGTVVVDSQGRVVSVQAGDQTAVVWPLLEGWVQVSGLAQTMAMVNSMQTIHGTAHIAAVQESVGGQILFTPNPHSGPFAFLRGHVQIGAQVLANVTVPLSSSASTSAGVSGGLVLNIPFGVGN